jgi:ribonuclease BN (tRNA processing enzyme)
MPDHGPVQWGDGDDGLGAIHDAALELAEGVDVLLHDAQHTLEEFPAVRHFGHATIDYAIALATRAHVKRLVLFHHDPARVDDDLDALAEVVSRLELDVLVAREGDVLEVR